MDIYVLIYGYTPTIYGYTPTIYGLTIVCTIYLANQMLEYRRWDIELPMFVS